MFNGQTIKELAGVLALLHSIPESCRESFQGFQEREHTRLVIDVVIVLGKASYYSSTTLSLCVCYL